MESAQPRFVNVKSSYARRLALYFPVALLAVSVCIFIYALDSHAESSCSLENSDRIRPCGGGNISKFACDQWSGCCFNSTAEHACYYSKRAIDDWWMIGLAFAIYVYVGRKIYSSNVLHRIVDTTVQVKGRNPEKALALVTYVLSAATLFLCNAILGGVTIGLSIFGVWIMLFRKEALVDPIVLTAVSALLLGHAENYHGLGNDALLLVAGIILFFLTFVLLYPRIMAMRQAREESATLTEHDNAGASSAFWLVSGFVLSAALIRMDTVVGIVIVSITYVGYMAYFYKVKPGDRRYAELSSGVRQESEADVTTSAGDNEIARDQLPLRF